MKFISNDGKVIGTEEEVRNYETKLEKEKNEKEKKEKERTKRIEEIKKLNEELTTKVQSFVDDYKTMPLNSTFYCSYNDKDNEDLIKTLFDAIDMFK